MTVDFCPHLVVFAQVLVRPSVFRFVESVSRGPNGSPFRRREPFPLPFFFSPFLASVVEFVFWLFLAPGNCFLFLSFNHRFTNFSVFSTFFAVQWDLSFFSFSFLPLFDRQNVVVLIFWLWLFPFVFRIFLVSPFFHFSSHLFIVDAKFPTSAHPFFPPG